MIVAAALTSTVSANGGSSEAIVVLHDAHEGGQAEITKNGFDGELIIIFD